MPSLEEIKNALAELNEDLALQLVKDALAAKTPEASSTEKPQLRAYRERGVCSMLCIVPSGFSELRFAE